MGQDGAAQHGEGTYHLRHLGCFGTESSDLLGRASSLGGSSLGALFLGGSGLAVTFVSFDLSLMSIYCNTGILKHNQLHITI